MHNAPYTNYEDAVQRAVERWLVYLSDGSPGALSVLGRTVDHAGWSDGLHVLQRLDSAGIRGIGIRVLFEDGCGSDIARFADRCATLLAEAV